MLYASGLVEDGSSTVCVCSAWFKLNKMANDMALDKLALPAISDADVLDVLRSWDFKERTHVFSRRETYNCCFVQPLLTTFEPQQPPKRSPGTCLCMLLKKTFSRHSPISWELQPVLLDASVLQMQLSRTQLFSAYWLDGLKTICPSFSLSPSHLRASP